MAAPRGNDYEPYKQPINNLITPTAPRGNDYEQPTNTYKELINTYSSQELNNILTPYKQPIYTSGRRFAWIVGGLYRKTGAVPTYNGEIGISIRLQQSSERLGNMEGVCDMATARRDGESSSERHR